MQNTVLKEISLESKYLILQKCLGVSPKRTKHNSFSSFSGNILVDLRHRRVLQCPFFIFFVSRKADVPRTNEKVFRIVWNYRSLFPINWNSSNILIPHIVINKVLIFSVGAQFRGLFEHSLNWRDADAPTTAADQ